MKIYENKKSWKLHENNVSRIMRKFSQVKEMILRKQLGTNSIMFQQ